MKSYVTGRDYRYQLPWFLLLGESGSGKTTALAASGLELPLKSPHDPPPSFRPGVNWCFFNKGVVLDVAGDYVLRNDAITSDESGWHTLLRLLLKHRPQRAIDGVILAIPCTDLTGQHTQDLDYRARIEAKASRVYRKLWQTQKVLGVTFPVYILVTKCDQVAGFRGFFGAIPERHQDQIFGWSSPYTRETVFRREWVKEAFSSIYQSAHRVQIEAFAENSDVEDPAGLFLFPGELRRLEQPLAIFLQQIFKESAYHESFLFRGIYFCGDVDSGGLCSWESEFSPEESATPADFDSSDRRPLFVRDFLENKLFSEGALARPVRGSLVSRNRMVVAAQAAALVIALFGGLGLYLANASLRNREAVLVDRLTLVRESIRDVTAINRKARKAKEPSEPDQHLQTDSVEHGITAEDAQRIKQRANQILTSLNGFSGRSFWSIFMPTSWFDPVTSENERSMAAAFDSVILESIHLGLDSKRQRVMITGPRYELLPLIEELNQLDVHVGYYNDDVAKKGLGNLDRVAELMKYLGYDPWPASFNTRNELYVRALREARGVPVDGQSIRAEGASAVARRIHCLYEQSFSESSVSYEYLDDIGRSDARLSEIGWLGSAKITGAGGSNTCPRSVRNWSRPRTEINNTPFEGMTLLAAVHELKATLQGLAKQRFMDPVATPTGGRR
ncbi:MAG TPA: type VI secretion protein IcmF/TssM N-terminal domain-containing protein, partial [Blastocatellia bacterium]|nr:type VI secretion protein IcmF/TssM N-terminal domain-containing protein [Blastocatellia bacterium]